MSRPESAFTGSTASPAPLRFGPDGRYVLQVDEQRLLVDGHDAGLGRRALDLLLALVSQPGHLFTKNELLDRVWPGLVVVEANLQMQVAGLRKVLGSDAITTVPGRGYRFTAQVVQAAAPALAEAPAPEAAAASLRRGGLFGRGADLQRVQQLLQPGACVTVVGPAGVGKTSLARAIAARLAGCVWVDLAVLPQGDDVAAAVARALGTSLSEGEPLPQLLRALQGQAGQARRLLVLDNAEHLIAACAALATQLRPLADLQLLVTSQLPLAVAGEHVHRLEPLALPTIDGADNGLAADDDGALALLVERIVAADHRYSPDAAAWPLLRAICTQLDGLPLALEMAAARVPLLGLQGVTDALAQRFSLLTRGHRDAATRHRTLHHALDWSYQLLDAAEQQLFRALGVFAGGFTLELVVALMADERQRWDVVDALATLVDRSLVVVGGGDPPRYRLLETMRAYAAEQQPESDAQALRQRHAAALLDLFLRHRPGDPAIQALCVAEMENAREAVTWAQAHDLALAAQLTAAIIPLANFTVWRQESTRWLRGLEAAMQQPAGAALPLAVQATWWTEFARTTAMRRDPRAAPAAQRALALWQQAGDARQALLAACVCVRSVFGPGTELDRACDALRARAAALPEASVHDQLQVHGALIAAATEREDLQAILDGRLAESALAAQLGMQARADAAESNVVFALNAMQRYAEAASRGRALLARIDAGSSSTQGNLPWVLMGLLKALVMMRSYDEALALMPRAWAAGTQFGVPVMAPAAALLAAMRGRFEAAAQLAGHAEEAFAAREMTMGVVDRSIVQQVHTLAGEALGVDATRGLAERGRWLDDAAAAALAAAD